MKHRNNFYDKAFDTSSIYNKVCFYTIGQHTSCLYILFTTVRLRIHSRTFFLRRWIVRLRVMMEFNVLATNPIELLVVHVHGERDGNHHLFCPPVKKYSAQVVHRVKIIQQWLVVDEEIGFEYQKVAVISDGVDNLVQMFPLNVGLARVRL